MIQIYKIIITKGGLDGHLFCYTINYRFLYKRKPAKGIKIEINFRSCIILIEMFRQVYDFYFIPARTVY